ncbi:murein biosynthesis integral membrane protein MurJ [bacterium]|nr:MAG: murein biosynthesis integral membrane protein MurJ [bacterium]
MDHARRLLQLANRRQTVGAAAILISFAYLVSRLIGLFRDRLLITHFGYGPELSAYNAAFRLPELLFTLLISGAFAVAFIPVFTAKLKADQEPEAWDITASLLNLLVLGTIAGAVLIFIFADPLTTLFTPGFDRHTHDLTVQLTRIMAVSPVLFAISSILGSVQQAFNRFFIFSIAGILYNLGIIIGIQWFAPHLGINGVAWGVVIGVILQAIIQIVGLAGLGFHYRPVLNLKLAGVRKTLKLMIPRSIDQGIDQIHYLAETMIGSLISTAAVGQFAYANNLKNVPLVLIGSSITTAVFPRLSQAAASGREKLIKAYVQTARIILFLAIPAALFAFVARGYIVRLLQGDGDVIVANTLGAFAGTIVFLSLFMLVSRVYYAMQDTRTPLYLSLASVPANIALGWFLSQQYGVPGLAASASIIAALETLILIWILNRREHSFGGKEVLSGGIRMLAAGIIMACCTYLVITNLLPLYATDKGFEVLAPKFATISLVAAITYLAPCYFLRLPEAKQFIGRLRDAILRTMNFT